MNKTKQYTLIYLSLLILIAVILIVFFRYDPFGIFKIVENTPLLSIQDSTSTYIRTYPNTTVENLWISYREKIQKDGRTIDRSRNYLTTSEGQSYSLLRAVWMDDKDTFDRVLKWTNHNLRKREGDQLFAWKWGQSSEGKWDVLYEEGGINTASDADQDIALALIFAYKRWDQDHYIKQAVEILDDIWRQEVLEIDGKYYLLAGNWAKDEEQPTVNPSYFSFMAYPIFAQVNPEHPWMALKETSYDVLEKATYTDLGYTGNVGIPPDWITIDRQTGNVLPVSHDDKTTDFSDDAFRVIWRVGLDKLWHNDPRASVYLERLDFLSAEWNRNGKIYSTYKHDGTRVTDYESLSTYGGILPYFSFVEPGLAQDIYYKKLAPLYNQDLEEFKEDIGYYPSNWVWFGMAFYDGKLINLYQIEQ